MKPRGGSFNLIGPLWAPRDQSTAFGVFFRFQVTNFDLLGSFYLCHFVVHISVYFGLFVVYVAFGNTEGQFMPIVIRIRAKPSKEVLKGEMVVKFIVKPEAFTQQTSL